MRITFKRYPLFANLQNNYQDIIPEVLKFVDDNQRILEEWRLDKWVDDRNLGRENSGMVTGSHSIPY